MSWVKKQVVVCLATMRFGRTVRQYSLIRTDLVRVSQASMTTCRCRKTAQLACSHTNSATTSVCRTNMTRNRSEEHTSELQSLMRISYAVFCLKIKKQKKQT